MNFTIKGADPDAIDSDGITALGWAALRTRIQTVISLLDKGATIGNFRFLWFVSIYLSQSMCLLIQQFVRC